MKIIDNSECLRGFGDLIRQKRERMELTQAEVAKEVGICRTYYGKIEAGMRDIPLVTALNICKALKIDISSFTKEYM